MCLVCDQEGKNSFRNSLAQMYGDSCNLEKFQCVRVFTYVPLLFFLLLFFFLSVG